MKNKSYNKPNRKLLHIFIHKDRDGESTEIETQREKCSIYLSAFSINTYHHIAEQNSKYGVIHEYGFI